MEWYSVCFKARGTIRFCSCKCAAKPYGKLRWVILPTKITQKSTCAGAGVSLYYAFFLRRFIMRRPKGIKTKKSVAKRFKITGTGKVMRSRAGKRHLLQTKSAKRRRSLGTSKQVDKTDTYRILQNLPFSH
jgi:large subunit ribosomal protein L35